MSDSRPAIVFANDHLPMLEAACALLQPAYNVVKMETSGKESVEWVIRLRPDFAVLDICKWQIWMGSLPPEHLIKLEPQRLLFLTEIEDDEDYVGEARLIAYGYVLKRRLASDLISAFFC